MLMVEWNMEDALAVRFEEGMELGREEGLELGIEQGREETARNALAQGVSPELIHAITGLEMSVIEDIRRKQRGE